MNACGNDRLNDHWLNPRHYSNAICVRTSHVDGEMRFPNGSEARDLGTSWLYGLVCTSSVCTALNPAHTEEGLAAAACDSAPVKSVEPPVEFFCWLCPLRLQQGFSPSCFMRGLDLDKVSRLISGYASLMPGLLQPHMSTVAVWHDKANFAMDLQGF